MKEPKSLSDHYACRSRDLSRGKTVCRCTYLVLPIKKVMFIPVCHLVCVFVWICVFCRCLCLYLDLNCTTSTPFGTVDQAISCKEKKNPTWCGGRERERERCIIFKSQPLGSVKTSDEYREGCGGVYLLVSVRTQLCLCVPSCRSVACGSVWRVCISLCL